MLNFVEFLTVGTLGILITIVLVRGLFSRNYFVLWSPIVFIAGIFLYYTVIGPILTIVNGQTYFKLLDHRPYFQHAWTASLLSFICILIGYQIGLKPIANKIYARVDKNIMGHLTHKYGVMLYVLGLLLFTTYAGERILDFINPLSKNMEGTEGGYSGAFKNYLVLAINFFIPALNMLLIGLLNRKTSLVLFVIGTAIATSIYASFGFRYRLVLLGISLLGTYYLYTRRRPSKIFITLTVILSLAIMGFIEQTRTYFGGLNIENVDNTSFEELVFSGFGEARIFMTMGLMIENIPKNYDYIYLEPYIQGLTIPIPRVLWPNKPAGEHIFTVYLMYDPIDGSVGTGSAWPVYGEMYFAFGWLGIAIGSLLLGFLCKKVFIWMQRNVHHPFVIIVYTVSLGYLYFIISRGYFPQHVILFFFTIYPAIFVLNRVKKLQYNSSDAHMQSNAVFQ